MVIFIKKIITIIIIAVFLLFQTSCKSESAKDFNELIKTINSEYGYNFNEEDFTIEKRENIIYHTLIDNQTLLSLYSNKENEIIQCTLSSFNINNQEIFELAAQLGTIICQQDFITVKAMLDSAQTNSKSTENGWCIAIIQNNNFGTILINKANSEINNNQLPTLKRNP